MTSRMIKDTESKLVHADLGDMILDVDEDADVMLEILKATIRGDDFTYVEYHHKLYFPEELT